MDKPTIVRTFEYAQTLEFEGVQFTASNNPGGTPGLIGWMSDWGVIQEWAARGLIEEKWYPHSYHHTDQIWAGPTPA